MSLIGAIGQLAYRWKNARARYLTEREISSLPFEIQKDIGWGHTGDNPRIRSRFDSKTVLRTG